MDPVHLLNTEQNDWLPERQRIMEEYGDPATMTREERRRAVREAKRQRDDALRRTAEIERDMVSIRKVEACLKELIAWGERPITIEANASNQHHDIIAALRGGRFINGGGWQKPWPHRERFEDAVPFVINRSYRGIFRDTDASTGEFILPYDECVFQYRIGGRAVAVYAYQHDNTVVTSGIFQTGKNWFGGDLEYLYDGKAWACRNSDDALHDLVPILGDEVRAISIMLDAEVAEAEVVRAPHKLNIARGKQGKPPINAYRTINLLARRRTRGVGEMERASPRLHFRRGHWRHYPTWKTWIRWQVVGDPSKGVVISDYKL